MLSHNVLHLITTKKMPLNRESFTLPSGVCHKFACFECTTLEKKIVGKLFYTLMFLQNILMYIIILIDAKGKDWKYDLSFLQLDWLVLSIYFCNIVTRQKNFLPRWYVYPALSKFSGWLNNWLTDWLTDLLLFLRVLSPWRRSAQWVGFGWYWDVEFR